MKLFITIFSLMFVVACLGAPNQEYHKRHPRAAFFHLAGSSASSGSHSVNVGGAFGGGMASSSSNNGQHSLQIGNPLDGIMQIANTATRTVNAGIENALAFKHSLKGQIGGAFGLMGHGTMNTNIAGGGNDCACAAPTNTVPNVATVNSGTASGVYGSSASNSQAGSQSFDTKLEGASSGSFAGTQTVTQTIKTTPVFTNIGHQLGGASAEAVANAASYGLIPVAEVTRAESETSSTGGDLGSLSGSSAGAEASTNSENTGLGVSGATSDSRTQSVNIGNGVIGLSGSSSSANTAAGSIGLSGLSSSSSSAKSDSVSGGFGLSTIGLAGSGAGSQSVTTNDDFGLSSSNGQPLTGGLGLGVQKTVGFNIGLSASKEASLSIGK